MKCNDVENFNFDNLTQDQVRKIIETIELSKQYRLQPDLDSVIETV